MVTEAKLEVLEISVEQPSMEVMSHYGHPYRMATSAPTLRITCRPPSGKDANSLSALQVSSLADLEFVVRRRTLQAAPTVNISQPAKLDLPKTTGESW